MYQVWFIRKSHIDISLSELLITFEAWVKLVQQWLVCAPLGIHSEPINKQLMLLVIILTAPLAQRENYAVPNKKLFGPMVCHIKNTDHYP